MSDCAKCRIIKFVEDSGLTGQVKIQQAEGELSLSCNSSCAKCLPPAQQKAEPEPIKEPKKAAEPKKAKKAAEPPSQPAKPVEGKDTPKEVVEAKPSAKPSAKPAPEKRAAKGAALKKEDAAAAVPAAAPAVEEKAAKKRSGTKKAAAEEAPAAPAAKPKTTLKLSFVFPRPRTENPAQYFTRVKPAVYYVLGGRDTVVDMPQHTDDVESSVWASMFPNRQGRDPPPLLAVRVSPVALADVADGGAKYEKLKEIFKDVDRLAVVNLDTKEAFQPVNQVANAGEKGNADRARRERRKPKPEAADLSTMECYQCGLTGHLARDCPAKKEKAEGEKAPARKREEGDRPPPQCYQCQQMGHMAKDCPNPKEPREASCWYCKDNGHIARDCPKKKEEATKVVNTAVCYNCQEKGHMAKECTNAKQVRSKPEMACYNCNGVGHMAKDCPEPQKERKKRPEGEQGGATWERRPKQEPRESREAREPREVKCQREVKDRDSGKMVMKGCGGPHAYGDCPQHKCVHCDDNHLSSRCPYMAS